jgi:hypothetical protein
MKNPCRWIIIAVVTFSTTGSIPVFSATTFTYTLPSTSATYQTSAAVYDSDDVLVRTLWRKEVRNAGANSHTWDDQNDSGTTAPAGTYKIQVICHNINYVWEGAVGNSSAETVGKPVNFGMNPIQDVAITGTKAFFVSGFSEAHFDFRTFSTTDPQRVTDAWGWVVNTLVGSNPVVSRWSNYARDWAFTTTDGTWVYFACPAGWRETPAGSANGVDDQPGYVVAMNVANNTPAYFTHGTCLNNGGCPMYPYPNGIQVGTQPGISGIAVQKTGSILAVAVGTDNKVYLYDKYAGNLLGDISITSPRRMTFDADDNLWVTSSNTVVCYTNVSTTPLLSLTISGFSNPLAVAVSPQAGVDLMIVADGGTSQQLKAFTKQGTSLWTYGQTGGYISNGPTVTNDKFWFTTGQGYSDSVEDTFVSFAPDGTFWVGDGDNGRTLHLDSARTVLDIVSTGHCNYVTSVVSNQSTRVFNGLHEYLIDYSKPLAGTNGSWTLVKNWRSNLASKYWEGTYYRKGLLNVTKLPNGATYAQVYNHEQKQWEVCELTTNGVRLTGTFLYGGTLSSDGSLRRAIASLGNGSFETNALTPWASASGGTLTIASSPLPPAAGARYLQIQATGNGGRVMSGIFQNIPEISPANGTTFNISFNVRKGSPSFDSVQIYCAALNSSGVKLEEATGSIVSSSISSTAWTSYQSDFALSNNPAFSQLQIKILFLKDGSSTSSTYQGMIDEIVVKQGTTVILDEGNPRWMNRPLVSYDTSGYAVWGPEVTLASISAFETGTPLPQKVGMGPVQSPVTDSNILISYDQSKAPVISGAPPKFHLGGIRVGDTKWLWKTAPASPQENFDSTAIGNYDVGDGVANAGNVVQTSGRHIIAGYHGEGWKQIQASQFMHFMDNGLFVGQFGTPGRATIGTYPDNNPFAPSDYIPFYQAVAGYCGNAMSPVVTKASDGETYMYVNDEWGYGPRRCKISGLKDLREYQGSGSLGNTVALTDVTPVTIVDPVLKNGSAESNSLSPWSAFYLTSSGTAPVTKGTGVVADPDFSAHGDNYFKFRVSGDATNTRTQAGIFTNITGIDLNNGRSFTLSFQVRNASINGMQNLSTMITSLNSANGVISQVIAPTSPVLSADSWTHYQCTLTLPASQPGFTQLQVRMQFYKDGSNPATAYEGYLDNIQVTQKQ